MAKKFHLLLDSPEEMLFDQEVEQISLPTAQGEIGIMADHTPLIALVSSGVITVNDGQKEYFLSSGGGFIEFKNNTANIFVQSAEFADSIDAERALAAAEKAKKEMAENVDEISLADATAVLERNIARLKTIEKRKRRSGTH